MTNEFGIIFILIMSYFGYRSRTLSKSGAFAAFIVGSIIFLGLSWQGLITIGAFFVSSSFWSKFKKKNKVEIEQKLTKGSQRDWTQVVANGGIAAIIAAFYYNNDSLNTLLLFLIAIASANSDTWASEIGTLSSKNPISIRTLKRVDKGTSGAVTYLGSFASFSGAFFIGIVSYVLFQEIQLIHILWVTLFGSLGSLIDTFIGATTQAKYKCKVCNRSMEKTVHCLVPTELVAGYSLFNNEVVNALSIMLSCLLFLLFLT